MLATKNQDILASAASVIELSPAMYQSAILNPSRTSLRLIF